MTRFFEQPQDGRVIHRYRWTFPRLLESVDVDWSTVKGRNRQFPESEVRYYIANYGWVEVSSLIMPEGL